MANVKLINYDKNINLYNNLFGTNAIKEVYLSEYDIDSEMETTEVLINNFMDRYDLLKITYKESDFRQVKKELISLLGRIYKEDLQYGYKTYYTQRGTADYLTLLVSKAK